MLSQAAIFAAVQRIARVRHEADDTAILSRAILQLLWGVERLGVGERTLAVELRRTRSALSKAKARKTRAQRVRRSAESKLGLLPHSALSATRR